MTRIFTSDGIRFADYPFPAASVAPSKLLAWSEVREVAPDEAPPEVRTHAGEVLFLTAADADELRAAAAAAGIAVVRRIDVWALLLEPFLDTGFSDEAQARTMATLAANGVPADEVARLRAQVGPTMVAYNLDSGLWDWVHLGLYDLLQAARGSLSGPAHRLPDDQFATLYWSCMEIAERAGLLLDPHG